MALVGQLLGHRRVQVLQLGRVHLDRVQQFNSPKRGYLALAEVADEML